MTSEQINVAIVEMYMDGATYREIGDALGFGVQSVSNRIRRLRDLGVKLPRRLTGITSSQIKQLNAIVTKSRSKKS